MSDPSTEGASSTSPSAPEPKRGLGDTAKRFASAGPLVPVIVWMLFWGPPWAFAFFVGIAIAIAANELFVMTIPESRGLRVWGVISTLMLAAAVAFGDRCPFGLGETLVSVFVVLLVGVLVSGLVVPDPVERAAARAGWLLAGPLYVGVSLAHIERLHLLPHGGGWVVMAMMLAWLSDTAAYFAGRWFGKTKLYPKLSPKKTVEGALGGLFGSVVGGLCGHFFLVPGLPLVDSIVLALVAGAAGQAGDLFESLLKRSTGVKDSGSILPGHGGLLDRADALMYTAMLTAAYAAYVLPHRS